MPTNKNLFNGPAENTLLSGDISSIVGAPMAENLSPTPLPSAGMEHCPKELKM